MSLYKIKFYYSNLRIFRRPYIAPAAAPRDREKGKGRSLSPRTDTDPALRSPRHPRTGNGLERVGEVHGAAEGVVELDLAVGTVRTDAFIEVRDQVREQQVGGQILICLLYTSDAADD